MIDKHDKVLEGGAGRPKPDLGQTEAEREKLSEEKLSHMESGNIPGVTRQDQKKRKPQSK
jgi:hypothetical protein